MQLDMGKFQEIYNEEYDRLYYSDNYIVGSREALEYFDSGLNDIETSILREFVLHRGDFITSDREAIAFMFAIDRVVG